MGKWHGLLEYFQFPLKILFFATILLGIGGVALNPNLEYLWIIQNETIIRICELIKILGGYIIQVFPFIVFIKILSKRFEDSIPVIVGFFGLVMMYFTVLFFMNNGFPDMFYEKFLGIEATFEKSAIFNEGTFSPYNMGIFPLIITYFITKYAYARSRHYSMNGVLSFVDHDSWAMLTVFLLSLLSGIALAFVWPMVIHGMEGIHGYIANDITSPINLFYYGLIDRISGMLHLGDITHQAFWLGEAGGSFADGAGIKHVGDVAIWTFQANHVLPFTAGRFITPYYVMNIFIIPGFLIGYYSLVKGKKDRNRYLLFFILAIVLSILSGNTFPFEVFMLIMAPLLYILYIVLSAFLFAIFQILDIHIGYNMIGSLMSANPGSLLDLIPYLRHPEMTESILVIMSVGFICMILFIFLTRVYFRKFALGLFQLSNRETITNCVIKALGGIDNILDVESTPDKLTASLINRDLVDFDELKEYGAYLILQAKEGYLIRLGNISTIVGIEIKSLLAKKTLEAE